MGPQPDPMTDRRSFPRGRYDEFAEWYLPWVGESSGLVCDPQLGVLAMDLSGQRWLDVACGAGRTSRELARRGATVIGVDVSDALISRARGDEAATPLGIRYIAADVTEREAWWDGEPFDGAVCEMAVMDIDDLDGTLKAVAEVLRRDGAFFVSLVNPCFPGNDQGLSSWPPDRGYANEGFWTSPHHNPDGVRIRVGSNHRMLSTYLNALFDAGLRLERAFEPATRVPTWLLLACRRQ